MKRFILQGFFLVLILITGCSNSSNNANEKFFEIHDIYSYEYNSIEPEHHDTITEWLNEARQNDSGGVSIHSISDDREQYGYKYIVGKGYKEFEITFVYSSDDMNSKGNLHIVGIEGEAHEEAFVKIKYDSRYVLGSIMSDNTIWR